MTKLKSKAYVTWMRSWLEKLDLNSRGHIGCLRFGKKETPEHKELKLKAVDGQLWPYMKFEHWLTEIVSADRSRRADVLLFTYPTPTVIEIANTESDESLQKKQIFWEGLGFDYLTIKGGNRRDADRI